MDDTEHLPAPWKPTSGEKLAGFITGRHERLSQYREETVTVLVFDAGDHEVSVWCSPKQLREFIDSADPKPGAWVEIRYEGETPVRGGHMMKMFSAAVGPLRD